MNIVNLLTLRHLKQNKRRTLITIIGVVISVAMLMAVSTLSTSFMGLMQKQNIANEGEWHVQFKNVNKGQLLAIEKDKLTKTLMISRDVGYSSLEGGQNQNKPYLFIREYNDESFKYFPIKLSKGRLPQAANEVVISEEIINNAKVNYKIGDSLSVDAGERFQEISEYPLTQRDSLQKDQGQIIESLMNKKKASYIIVGMITRPIWEPTNSPGYTVLSYVDESLITASETVNASIQVKKLDTALFIHIRELAKQSNIDTKDIEFNNGLLRFYGVTDNDGLRSTLFFLTFIIMTVIIIGSVSLIYNAFAISVSERSRHLGMLASVGATKRQKRNSVYFEGFVIGMISIPIGIVSGLVGIAITFWLINSKIQDALGVTERLTVIVTPVSVLITCVVSIVTIFISTYLPAVKASKISAIDAIRQTTDVRLTGKTVRTSKLIRKIFGIEAEIGLKNLKRNKRRYQATVFSLVLSIILFLAVSFFTSNLQKSLQLTQDNLSYDIQVIFRGEKSELLSQHLKHIASLKEVTKYSQVKELIVNSWIDKNSTTEDFKVMVNDESSMFKNGNYLYQINVHALEKQDLKAYAEIVGADYKMLEDTTNLSAIVIDTVTRQRSEDGKYIETKAVLTKAGRNLDLMYIDWEKKEETQLNKVNIAALTDVFPMGVTTAGIGELDIVVSNAVLDKLVVKQMIVGPETYLYLNSKDPMNTQQEIEKLKSENIIVNNVYKYNQRQEQTIMLMSVFTYGFIALITAISIANIYNTISTSISLRKREFAMLKSVGLTPKGFNKMIHYESIFYGVKSLLYGLPTSIIIMYLIHRSLMNSFDYKFALPLVNILYVIVAVFIIVGSAMLYSSSKMKKENIIDALKQESI
ncbi:ABC transporter permease [Paenibacillus wynnii]|uniref:Cell division protein FtsX n=1 Tax=Paenibacillus wynnii TaxID=268407 RepID=A0A098M4Y3_9BACL|nr:FtsX-like permease family protein [Paenibacillus wynnii]KGE17111.1 cell division protein FtsX [Paenibacillus wynnii]